MGRYINFYIANGAGAPVKKTGPSHGKLENVDVQNVHGVGHMSIDKNRVMQQKVISEIDAVVLGRSAQLRGHRGRDSLERQTRRTRRGQRRGGPPIVRNAGGETRMAQNMPIPRRPIIRRAPVARPPAFEVRRAARRNRNGKRMRNAVQLAVVVAGGAFRLHPLGRLRSRTCRSGRAHDAVATVAPDAPPAATQAQARVYLFRARSVRSFRGMDRLTERLQKPVSGLTSTNSPFAG